MIDDQIFPKVVLCSVGCKVKAHWGKIQDAKVLPTMYSEPFLFAGIATDFDPRAIITQMTYVYVLGAQTSAGQACPKFKTVYQRV